jgi:hypothetical protein
MLISFVYIISNVYYFTNLKFYFIQRKAISVSGDREHLLELITHPFHFTIFEVSMAVIKSTKTFFFFA